MKRNLKEHVKKIEKGLGDRLEITRRDFLNSSLLGAGAALLYSNAPLANGALGGIQLGTDWYGYGGVGDYAASHGNTPELTNNAHAVRDGVFDSLPADTVDTGEVYDLVVVGAGIAGLGAAYHFNKIKKPGQTCLILDNHPIFGGESKRNEFEVDGHHLIGPQGANGFTKQIELRRQTSDERYIKEFNIPIWDINYHEPSGMSKDIRFARDNYGFFYWQEPLVTTAYVFDEKHVIDPMMNGYKDMPYSDREKEDLQNWRHWNFDAPERDDFDQWLDTMSYKDYLEKVIKFSPVVTGMADRILAGALGMGADAVSALGAKRTPLPVGRKYKIDFSNGVRFSFPGGNDAFARYFIKVIMPRAISGSDSFEDILNGRVNFDQLDQKDQAFNMRLNATVVRVEHDNSDLVSICYLTEKGLYKIRARGVVMATGAWVNKFVIRDLPASHREAYTHFDHAAFLVANIALKSWRFIEETGSASFIWSGGFGNSCNVRHPMTVGDYQPPFDPDKPIVLSFYHPYYYPGLSAKEQGIRGRMELLTTSYADYEKKIINQMYKLFGQTGFDAGKHLAGIVLNRWGHAYVNPKPGFYIGRNGKPTPSDIIRRRFGRIAIGHSELAGHQHWGPAADEGKRAVESLADIYRRALCQA